MIDHQGFKIGVVGFADQSWMDSLGIENDCSKLELLDYNEQLKKHTEFLKDKFGCDLIVSLNHMMQHEDLSMAHQSSELDMIFGGHDHFYYTGMCKDTGVFIQKSGTDFESFTNSTVLFGVDSQDEVKKFKSEVSGD